MEEGINFNNRVIWKLSENVWITETIYNAWWISLVLIILAVVVRVKLKKFTAVPTSTFQNIVELAVESFENFVSDTIGKKYAYYANWFFGVFAFLLFSNMSGLLAMRPPTTSLATTFALGLTTFVMIHVSGLAMQKGHYFKEYVEPNPVFIPLKLVEAIATPISLSCRLFGNILGGFIVIGLVYALVPIYFKFVIPGVLHGFFDIFEAALQAYIFCILSMTFIRERLPEEE